jgi:hypothetical protein
MKRIFTTILMAVGITGPFVSHLAAQGRTAADISFAFTAGNQTMPAGHYDVSQLSQRSSVFTLRAEGGPGRFVLLGIEGPSKSEKPSVTFACYGNERVLAKITSSDGQTTYSLSDAAVEKQLHHRLGLATMLSIKLAAR